MNLPRWTRAFLKLNQIHEVMKAIAWTENWWILTCAYLKFGNITYPIKLASRSGFKFEIDNYHDCVTIWVVFCRQEYTVPINAKVILDLGANFGAFTLFAADIATNSQIFSIEPFPKSFNRLLENTKLNGLKKRVSCLALAIASNSGQRKMSIEDGVDQSRGLIQEDTLLEDNEDTLLEGNTVVLVKAISLMEILETISKQIGTKEIDLVKMDIEGGEHEWLPNLSPDVLKNIREWQMEYHPNGSKSNLFRTLESAGFSCIRDVEVSPNSGVAHFRRI